MLCLEHTDIIASHCTGEILRIVVVASNARRSRVSSLAMGDTLRRSVIAGVLRGFSLLEAASAISARPSQADRPQGPAPSAARPSGQGASAVALSRVATPDDDSDVTLSTAGEVASPRARDAADAFVGALAVGDRSTPRVPGTKPKRQARSAPSTTPRRRSRTPLRRSARRAEDPREEAIAPRLPPPPRPPHVLRFGRAAMDTERVRLRLEVVDFRTGRIIKFETIDAEDFMTLKELKVLLMEAWCESFERGARFMHARAMSMPGDWEDMTPRSLPDGRVVRECVITGSKVQLFLQ